MEQVRIHQFQDALYKTKFLYLTKTLLCSLMCLILTLIRLFWNKTNSLGKTLSVCSATTGGRSEIELFGTS